MPAVLSIYNQTTTTEIGKQRKTNVNTTCLEMYSKDEVTEQTAGIRTDKLKQKPDVKHLCQRNWAMALYKVNYFYHYYYC